MENNEQYIPENPLYYNYAIKNFLIKDAVPYFDPNLYERIILCVYSINTTGKYPFIQYLLSNNGFNNMCLPKLPRFTSLGKDKLIDYKFEWDNHDELVIIPNNMLKIIKTIYENIGMKYSGHTQEFNKQIQELNIKILELQNKEAMYLKDIENLLVLNQKDAKIHEHEIKSKDLEIDNLKKEIKILNLEMQLASKH